MSLILEAECLNDQFRICFRWVDGNAEDVEIVDYWRGFFSGISDVSNSLVNCKQEIDELTGRSWAIARFTLLVRSAFHKKSSTNPGFNEAFNRRSCS